MQPALPERECRPRTFSLEAVDLSWREAADEDGPTPPREDAAVIQDEGTVGERVLDDGASFQKSPTLGGYPNPDWSACARYGTRGTAVRRCECR